MPWTEPPYWTAASCGCKWRATAAPRIRTIAAGPRPAGTGGAVATTSEPQASTRASRPAPGGLQDPQRGLRDTWWRPGRASRAREGGDPGRDREMASGGEIMAAWAGGSTRRRRTPDALLSPSAALGGVAAADPGVGAGPGPGVDLATSRSKSRSRTRSGDRDPPPSRSARRSKSKSSSVSRSRLRSRSRSRSRNLHPCPRGNPSPGRDLRVLPSLRKRKERCPLSKW